ncbi:MAG: tRNA uridine(34) 5-carboxymethylaminomethyl modification radical SAM/GNAT enzyme Elp3 [bacterium]|nr:tRNA uridine(34) 5-carboxymethylaminomethyl modification radical SAM/GNAT enzyme Elp3 [bacterium]
MNEFESAIKELVKTKVETLAGLDSAKRKIAKKFKITIPSNVNLLKAYHNLVQNKRIKKNKTLEIILIKRRVRSLSGIVNVSILTKPYGCPGKCIYCPSQKGIPKSYLEKEPAVQRAVLTNFDPYLQIQTRLESLKATGHPTDKIELRIIGGTWSFYPRKYQKWFVLRCFQACNKHKASQISNFQFPISKQIPNPKFQKSKFLEKEQKKNERAKHRIIGITIETRPDFITLKEIKRLRELGVTRVELGVQSIYDDVLKLNKRGHLIKETIKATKLLKDAGFKVSFQIMPNLPGSNFKKDVNMFKELFSNPNFQPDLLKIYPLDLVKQASLYKWYKQNKFRPYSKEKLIKLLTEIKKQIPYYVRIERIIRDIPSSDIVAGGVKISNLREIVQKNLTKLSYKCKCIRCREIKGDYDPKEKLYLFRQNYDASEGKEIFLSFENKNRTKLYALLRLRILKYTEARPLYVFPVLEDSAIIREIHTYGRMAQIQKTFTDRVSIGLVQHRGLGKKLIEEAERITKQEFNLKKIAVISGIGVRNYYRKLGYKLEDTYMIKKS